MTTKPHLYVSNLGILNGVYTWDDPAEAYSAKVNIERLAETLGHPGAYLCHIEERAIEAPDG